MRFSIVIGSLVVLLSTLTTFAGQVPKKSEVSTPAQRTMLEALLQDAKTLDQIAQRGQDTRVDMAQYQAALDVMSQRNGEIREKLQRTDLRILACLMTNSYIDLGKGRPGPQPRPSRHTPGTRGAGPFVAGDIQEGPPRPALVGRAGHDAADPPIRRRAVCALAA